MIVRKSFQFRLRPTKKQSRLLQEQLDECRWLYNEALSQRKLSFEELNISLSKYQQAMMLPFLKEERATLNNVHSQVLQNVLERLDKAFQFFFDRCKRGETPGFPRFRGEHRYNSFCYPQSGFAMHEKEISLSKIGKVRINMHREIAGVIKTCTLKKNVTGAWDVCLSCEVDVSPLEAKQESVGIDVGLESFATLTNGQKIQNPRFFKQQEKKLAKAQAKLSKCAKGTKERKKAGKVVAKIHEKIKNQRKDFCHKEAKKIVDQYQYICMEDLNIKNMMQKSPYAKAIADVSWHQFRQILTYKAEEAGRKIGFVNPAYTSRECSQCGNLEEMKLSTRTFKCSRCEYKEDRDVNASLNILALGLDGLGAIPRSLRI